MKIPKAVKLPSGRWNVKLMIDGVRLSITEPTKKAAEAKAAAVKMGMTSARHPQDLTVGDAIDRYIDSKDAVLSPSTILGYRKLRANTLQALMSIPVSSLTQEAVQMAVNDMARTKSPKYVKNAHGLLSAMLRVYRPTFALQTTLPQQGKPDITIPTTEEVQRIAQFVKGKKFELPFLLAAGLGLRTSEIRGLTWDCVGFDTIHIKYAMVDGPDGPALKLTKTYSSDRVLSVPPYIMQLIDAQPRTDEYVVHYNRNQLYKCLWRACNSLGLPHHRFHDLRHYQASIMLALNVPNKYAQVRMGHATDIMLKTVYQHTMQQKLDQLTTDMNDFFDANISPQA